MKPNAEHIAPDNQEVAERFPTFRKELQEFVTQVLNNLRVSQGWSWEKLFEELDSIKTDLDQLTTEIQKKFQDCIA